MSVRTDPKTGNALSYPSDIPALTPEQRALCYLHVSTAQSLLNHLDKSLPYFTAFQVNCFRESLIPLVKAGLLTEHRTQRGNGWYYKPIKGLTRVWCLTTLADRDERIKHRDNQPTAPNGAER